MEGQVISLPRKDWSDGCSETNYDCMQNGGITFIFVNKETFFSRYALPPPVLFYRLVYCLFAAFSMKALVLCYLKFKQNVRRWGKWERNVVSRNEPLVWAAKSGEDSIPKRGRGKQPGQLTGQLVPVRSTFGNIQMDHIVNVQLLATVKASFTKPPGDFHWIVNNHF